MQKELDASLYDKQTTLVNFSNSVLEHFGVKTFHPGIPEITKAMGITTTLVRPKASNGILGSANTPIPATISRLMSPHYILRTITCITSRARMSRALFYPWILWEKAGCFAATPPSASKGKSFMITPICLATF